MLNRLAAALFSLCMLAVLSPASAQQVCPDPYSARGICTPVTSSATGTTGAITATLPAAAGKTTYICGFFFTGTNTTAATAVNLTVTGAVGGTLNFGFQTLAVAATTPNPPPLDEAFLPCLPATAINTAIVVNGPALGAGATQVTIVAWGYQL